ncbi:MAG: 2-amino-4-hydroxy-6-hydroxymethyldihydropteridine diphosphokinase [Phycisphaerales bacterium]|nr:2-amino-4-hydroxy-6-hydroxymethyldihydropteridine diphosphokinase [Phycisphaerales bacterium]
MVQACIALGSNLESSAGSPLQTLRAACDALDALRHCHIEKISSVWKTAPVGSVAQPDFFNAAVLLSTSLTPRTLLLQLHAIEQSFGRCRNEEVRFGPRTLDLDIIFYGTQIIDEPDFKVPHPRYAERGFVLFPLSEIAPSMVDPKSGLSVESLLRSFPNHDGVARFGQLSASDR